MREIERPRTAPDGQRVTMQEAGREFCQRLELKGRRKSHRLTVASDLRNHIAPFLAAKTLDRIKPEDIDQYVAAKRQLNPVKLADRPTLEKTETRIQFLDQAEFEQLVGAPYADDAFGSIEPTLS